MQITIKPNEERKLTHSITVDINFDIPITGADAREWVLNALNHYMDAEGKCPDMEDYTEKVITEPEPELAAVVKSKKILNTMQTNYENLLTIWQNTPSVAASAKIF